MCKVVFLLIRPKNFFGPFLLPLPLSITRFHILFEILMRASLLALDKSLYIISVLWLGCDQIQFLQGSE